MNTCKTLRAMFVLVSLGMILAISAVSLAAQAEAGTNSVSRQEAICIARVADALLEEPDDPVTVYLDICMSSENQDAAIAGQVRTDLPNLKDPVVDPGALPVKSVTLSKKTIECLKNRSMDPAFPSTDPVILEELCR